ncbi:hypothetical protein TNCV_3846311 [Trichonephila clavipes]|nr:hypothetical protein TNCV_3846311 [Trichonephila clavipes]
MVLEPHTVYRIPAGTRYIVLMVQKTVFGLDIIPEAIVPLLFQTGFNLLNFRKMKRSRVLITPIIRLSIAPVWIAKLSTALASLHPVIIPELQHSVQIPSTPQLTTPQPPVQIPATSELTTPQPPVQIPATPELTTPRPPVQMQ